MKRERSSSSSSTASFTTAKDESPKQLNRPPVSLARAVSPPPVRLGNGGRLSQPGTRIPERLDALPSTAQVEAGQADVEDHVAFFSSELATFSRQPALNPRLTHADWRDLYHRNQHSNGHHFVVHQHDHPIAGTHYDLRLQINATSSISFAIMYGLPGDPNSKRLNRNATETRVHCVWVCIACAARYAPLLQVSSIYCPPSANN